jgi:alanyl-tRNA synthetase
MTSNEIRKKFLKFFENRGHKIIPSASLVPENDPSVLFNTAGMQPIVPYLLGQRHPMGTKLVNIQKCIRTGDIDEVGDNRHLTFFEMLGNWSLGDYFKPEAIEWSFEFLTSKEEGLGLDIKRIYVTVFEGDNNAPKDIEAADIWKKYLPEDRIYFLPAKNNWWSAGDNGPCGPDTEIFYDTNEVPLGDMTHDEFVKADDEGRVIEIWNNVFMEYEKALGKVVGKLAKHNVDTGMGLERIVMVSQGVKTVFDTDLFGGEQTREERIIIDHVKASLFMISDGVIPGNTGRGYVLRRLIRRASKLSKKPLHEMIEKIKKIYEGVYDLDDNGIIKEEEEKFRLTLEQGLKEFEKGVDPFDLYQSFGFPIELTIELAKEKGINIDREDFDKKLKEHQELSRTSSAGMFKGGLAGTGEMETKYHTATHMLLAALRQILGGDITQKGSNITAERMRFDFNWGDKLTAEQLKLIEDLVNEKISDNIIIEMIELPKDEALKIVKNVSFDLSKYGDIVKVYKIGDFSAEFCGGPHVESTGVLGHFKIIKEEASSQGVRRIKAILE